MSMPILFVGHGSPMNAIENNEYTYQWSEIGKKVKPKAILMVSAHWFVRGTYIQNEESPKIINDMYGFPDELYSLGYQVKGSQSLTQQVIQRLNDKVSVNNSWGLDHGAWSVLAHMYPKKDISVVQLSVNANATPEEHYRIGRELLSLRDEGIFIIGSGNIVHNLRQVRFDMNGGYDWNISFDQTIKQRILEGSHDLILDYRSIGDAARLSVPSTDHFDPLFYIIGASKKEDKISVFNESAMAGSLSMTSYLFE